MKRALDATPLAALIDLEKRVRGALTIDEFRFIVVNETHNLFSYRQAILFGMDGDPLAISGVSEFSESSSFIYWLKKQISPIVSKISKPCQVTEEDLESASGSNWADWLPPYGYLQPLLSPTGEQIGSLFLLRDYKWSEDEQHLLEILSGAYGHALIVLEKPKKGFSRPRINWVIKVLILMVIIFIFFVPVPLTVLAPAEIVAVNPSIIRAPVNGVVEKILIKPNEEVRAGEILFRMDAVSKKSELIVAQKIFNSLKAQYSQLIRQSLSDPKSKKFLAETMGRMKEQEARIQFLKQLIARMQVPSPVNGTVILDDPASWEGRPVNLGEKILSLADKNMVEIEAWLSVADAIELLPGSSMRIYLNSNPLAPVEGVLSMFSYGTQLRPEGFYSHRLTSEIKDKSNLPRLGLRGTARFEGKEVSFVYWIFRRPIAALRQFFGI